MTALTQLPMVRRRNPYASVRGVKEWFHFDQLIPIHLFSNDPRHVDARLDHAELQVVRDMWQLGYIPSKPVWEMWVEREVFADDAWVARVRVTIQGVHRSAM